MVVRVDSKKTALITGVSGQDGSYLAEYLLSLGYRVIGTTRDPGALYGKNIRHLRGSIELVYCNYDRDSLVRVIEQGRPDEIYNLAGQTYVSKSWEMMEATLEVSGVLPSVILNSIASINPKIKFFQASSSEVFYPKDGERLTEDSPISPKNPYACSKAFAHQMLHAFRNKYGVYAVNGILFNHESPRRAPSFLSQKVVTAACEIKLGLRKELELGNLEVSRDWGYAKDYVVAIHKMLQMNKPQDLLICSGENHQVRELVQTVFSLLDLDWEQYCRVNANLIRKDELMCVSGSNERAKKVLNWGPKTSFREFLRIMTDHNLKELKGNLA